MVSELLLNVPLESKELVNAYFDGAAAAIRLYAHWKDGEQYVGTCGRPLKDALQDLENMRQSALEDALERG